MAQPHDIEDVLSSIRRLVANDGPAPRQVETADEADAVDVDEAEAQESEALLLAPAQRVTDPEDPFQMIRTLAQEERDARDAEHFLNDEAEDKAALVADIDDTDKTTATFYHHVSAVESAEDTATEDTGEEPAISAEAEIDMPSATADVPADYQEDTDYQAEQPIQLSAARTTDASTADVAAWDADADDINEGEDALDDDVDLADLSALAEKDDALRELISEIVRQELSGALGERITRNVRKLVRREIRSILSSGEFD